MASQRPSPSRTLLPWIGITFIDKYCPGQWTYILHYIHMILLKPTQCLQWNFDHMECQGKSFSKNLWSSMSTCTSPPLASFTSSAGIAPLITEAYEHSLINCIELNRTSTMNSRLPGSLYSLSSPPSIEKPSLHLISTWCRVAKGSHHSWKKRFFVKSLHKMVTTPPSPFYEVPIFFRPFF